MKIFSQRNYINALLLIALVILTGSNILSYQQIQQLLATNNWVIHTHDVIEAGTDLKYRITDASAEINQSTYSSEPVNQEHFFELFARINSDLARLRKLTSNNPGQQYNINKLEPIVEARIAILNTILAADSDKNKQLTLILSTNKKRQELRSEIDVYTNKIIQEERDLLEHRTTIFERAVSKTNFIFIIVTLLSEALLLLSIILLNHHLTQRDKAERKNAVVEKMKNEFVSVVSHELRTPITSIRGALSLISGGAVGEFSEKTKKLLDIANHNCDRLQILINDILDIEKMESGKMNFDLKKADLCTLVEESVSANKLYGEKYGIEIHLVKSDAIIMVYVDTDRLIQVLTNLLSNAVKFSSKDKTVLVNITKENDCARVAVTNQGREISKEFESRIFQKFSQADSSDSRSKDGSGLGLNISKSIIEKMGGILNFTSTVNDGTTFYFELPICHIISENKTAEAIESKNALLICENNKDQANYLKILLESAGFLSDIAHTVAEAKKLLLLNSYHIILLDLILPDEDGISFIRELRKNEKTANLPIIVQSIIAQKGSTLMNGEAFAVIDWLDKPMDISKLLNSINLIKARNRVNRPKILHVDDDSDTHHVVQSLLEDYAEIIDANTLDDARNKLSLNKFDLVILDLLLPDGNGIELLPLLSKYKCPVTVYSAIELDRQYSMCVKQTLVKSKTSNEELIELIQHMVN